MPTTSQNYFVISNFIVSAGIRALDFYCRSPCELPFQMKKKLPNLIRTAFKFRWCGGEPLCAINNP